MVREGGAGERVGRKRSGKGSPGEPQGIGGWVRREEQPNVRGHSPFL